MIHVNQKHTNNPQSHPETQVDVNGFFQLAQTLDEVFQRAALSLRLGGQGISHGPGENPARCSVGQADTSRTDPGPLRQPKSTAAAAPAPASTSAGQHLDRRAECFTPLPHRGKYPAGMWETLQSLETGLGSAHRRSPSKGFNQL